MSGLKREQDEAKMICDEFERGEKNSVELQSLLICFIEFHAALRRLSILSLFEAHKHFPELIFSAITRRFSIRAHSPFTLI